MLAALEEKWGPSPAQRGLESDPCALEHNPALHTFVEVSASAEVHFGGSTPFCVEAWIKPTDAEHTPHTFVSYGGTIFAKYNDLVSGVASFFSRVGACAHSRRKKESACFISLESSFGDVNGHRIGPPRHHQIKSNQISFTVLKK